MPWESAAIGLLTDALKSLMGRIMESCQERRAAQLISEATRELLLEQPHIEKVRANLMEAEKLLRTPSPELLHAQVFLDRVARDYDSAHSALQRMREAYEWQGNLQGLAQTNALSGATFLEVESFKEASESFRQAIEVFARLGDNQSILNILPDALEAYLHEGLTDQAQELLTTALRVASSYQDHRSLFTILISLGMSAATCKLELLALRAFSTSWAMQRSDNLWAQIKKSSDALSLSEDQLNKIVAQMQEAWESGSADVLVACLFDD